MKLGIFAIIGYPSSHAGIAQWQSNRFVSERLEVQLLFPAQKASS